MSDYITPLPKLFARSLTIAVNRAVRLDPAYAEKLADVDACSAQVQLKGTGLTFVVEVNGGEMAVSELPREDADVTLAGTPAALFSLAGPAAKRGRGGRVEVRGDALIGQRFAECFQTLDFDWEEPLSRALGDVAGHHLANFIRGGLKFGQRTAESLRTGLRDYVTEERRWVVSGEELTDFCEQVDDLREDVDRLEARLQQIERSGSA